MEERPILVDDGPLADGLLRQLEVVGERLKLRKDVMCTYGVAAQWSDEERNQIMALLEKCRVLPGVRRRSSPGSRKREIVAELLRRAEQQMAQLDQAASESNRRWDEMHTRHQHLREGRSRWWRSRP